MLTKTLLALSFTAAPLIANSVTQKLDARMVKTDSIVCIGLDPDITKMPHSITMNDQTDEEKIYEFLTSIVDITSSHACSYKLQKAFYDYLENGHTLLKDVVHYIHTHHPDMPIFVDCKIGDTDNTMLTYMKLLFNDIKADGIVINPYMGDDVLEPFIKDAEKCGIVLIQTSNPNAKIIQEIKTAEGLSLWETILDITISKWNSNQNLIVVLSSNTNASHYASIRNKIPQNMPILLAGIGSQGGDPLVLKQLLNKDNRGVFVNSSRGIIYAYNQYDENWKSSVEAATIELKDTLNAIRNS